MSEKRALVTGATGFIGSHVTRRLHRDGWDVHIVTRSGSDRSGLQNIYNRLTVHKHDGSTQGMVCILKKSRPDAVFHLASLFLAQHQSDDIEPLIKSNLLFGTQLMEAMAKSDVRLLINTGTSWQHYENQLYSPVNLYAATKQAFEMILQFYLETTPMKAITLKLFDTYGPDDPRPKLFTLLRNAAQKGQALPMSPGEQLIDLVYIEDVVEAFILAAERLQTGQVDGHEIYAVSSGNPIKLRELVNRYVNIICTKLPVEWGEKPYRPREVMIPWHTGRSLPGWKPRISLDEGISMIAGLRT